MIFSMMSMFCFSSEITNLDVSNLFTVMDFLTRAFYVAARWFPLTTEMNEKSCLRLKYPVLSAEAVQQQILRTNLISKHSDCFFSGRVIPEITLSCDHVNHTYVQVRLLLLVLLWKNKVNVNISSPLQF